MMGGASKAGKSGSESLSETPGWVVTFADLMTLLFCFFVLLTTLSTQPKNCKELEEYLTENNKYFKNYELRSSKLECILSLPSDFLFRSGEGTIQKRALDDMVPLFNKVKNMDEHQNDLMIVEGHTDNVPINTAAFPSNWELSSARATNIATFLVNRMKFTKEMVSIAAYADSRPKVEYKDIYGSKLSGNELKAARKTNRRVEIIFVNQPESRKETSMLFDGR